MKKPWSLSTTVRNPDRILPFLLALSEMEGESFDQAGQVKFQTLLIKNKLYTPTGLDKRLQLYYEDLNPVMSFEQASEIFAHMLSRSIELKKDSGLRGRVSVAPLTKMGLAVASKSSGAVVITDIGRSFMNGSTDIGDIYFRFFLKWQIPTPGSNDFSDRSVYDIQPFIGTLQLIGRVNQLAEEAGLKVKGLSKSEFSIFAHTLVRHEHINYYAQSIISIRKLTAGKSKTESKQIFKQQSRTFISGFLGTTDVDKIDALYNSLFDYGDNSIKYFRLTRYVYIRGGGYYIDLEPRRSTEIDELLKMSAASREFESEDDYSRYLTDSTLPVLPWETSDKLSQILTVVQAENEEYESQLALGERKHIIDVDTKNEATLKTTIEAARQYRRELQEQLNHKQAASIDSLSTYIDKLTNIYQLEDRPVQLEKFTSLGLHSLNDALSIKPNYPVGDDNEPTFTAPANVPDIECFYEGANSICEVTMLTSRDQYYNEGQPVMRHLRDFESRNVEKPSYCLFIAPKLHRDTINSYWYAVKYEYEGSRQRIVPMTIGNFVQVLQVLKSMKQESRIMRHTDIIDLYDRIVSITTYVDSSEKWLERIPEEINAWSASMLMPDPQYSR